MDIEKLKHAANLARGDLFLATTIPEMSPYNWRLEQSIQLLTEGLGDAEEFKNHENRWKEESKKWT